MCQLGFGQWLEREQKVAAEVLSTCEKEALFSRPCDRETAIGVKATSNR